MDNEYSTNVHETHRQMNRGAVIGAAALFVLLIVGMFVFAYMKRSEQIQEVVEPTTTEEDTSTPYDHITRIDATHYYIDGVHTLVGEIAMPTPCDLLDYDVVIAESYPEQVTIDFVVINNAETCTQTITPARFKVEATVAEEATWSARFMGRSIELNRIPAPEGERPENFEVFLKG